MTRYADDWVVTCDSWPEAVSALTTARRIVEKLGVVLHAEKTRIVHVRYGFEFLGYKIKRGSRGTQAVPRKDS
ncbi:MAG: reverse transcriptase domain-containing protein [Thermodesulfobacteriota bacterium]